ncbi:MAG: hypothetical protein GAK29_01783 [Acinetobacter bereziniae]|uniref:Uncharacterized protein n=1 Tax=Acinetobacter bereziniae TaxID=106648 RepID=A0A833PG46_ACIBZ|nr:MAG: hypothetical protein GAK29_01783 [Acinetobacter bereziniae]
MSLSNNIIKFFFALFLMVNFSNTYAKSQVVDTQVQEAAAEAMEAAEAEAVPASDTEAACRADDACDVASDVSDDEKGTEVLNRNISLKAVRLRSIMMDL